MAVTGMMTWPLALAFLGGFAGGDSAGVVLVALSACLQGGAAPRAAWRWAVLALTGWAAGSAIAMLLVHAGAERYFDAPDGAESAFVMLAALASAYAGATLAWVATRLARES